MHYSSKVSKCQASVKKLNSFYAYQNTLEYFNICFDVWQKNRNERKPANIRVALTLRLSFYSRCII